MKLRKVAGYIMRKLFEGPSQHINYMNKINQSMYNMYLKWLVGEEVYSDGIRKYLCNIKRLYSLCSQQWQQ